MRLSARGFFRIVYVHGLMFIASKLAHLIHCIRCTLHTHKHAQSIAKHSKLKWKSALLRCKRTVEWMNVGPVLRRKIIKKIRVSKMHKFRGTLVISVAKRCYFAWFGKLTELNTNNAEAKERMGEHTNWMEHTKTKMKYIVAMVCQMPPIYPPLTACRSLSIRFQFRKRAIYHKQLASYKQKHKHTYQSTSTSTWAYRYKSLHVSVRKWLCGRLSCCHFFQPIANEWILPPIATLFTLPICFVLYNLFLTHTLAWPWSARSFFSCHTCHIDTLKQISH